MNGSPNLTGSGLESITYSAVFSVALCLHPHMEISAEDKSVKIIVFLMVGLLARKYSLLYTRKCENRCEIAYYNTA